MVTRVALLALLFVPIAQARADIPMPNQELCTVELQQQDGSQCEACSWHGPTPGAHEEACGGAIARGLTRRCGYGATGAVAVYCDREADWIAVGRGSSGCGCDAGPGGASNAWLLAMVLLALRFRRADLPR